MAACFAGLHITDASQFADYIPTYTDAKQQSTAAESANPSASSSSPALQTDQMLPGTPHGVSTPGQAMQPHNSGQQPIRNRQRPPVSGQKAPDSGQQMPVGAHQDSANGQIQPVSGQSLLSRVQSGKRSKQTTLGGLEQQASRPVSYSPDSPERPSKSARRQSILAFGQKPAADGQSLPSSSKSFVGTAVAHKTHARPPHSESSPYANIAQVLDLTNVVEEDTSAVGFSQHQPVQALTNSGHKRRRHALLQSHNQSDQAGGKVVDLT